MKPVHIAHIADSHLGYRKGDQKAENGRNARNVDIESAWRAAVLDIAEAHKSQPYDLFIHAGDVFDRPRPDMSDIRAIAWGIQVLKTAGIPQLWIAGNHDMSRTRTPDTALTLLAGIYADELTRFAFNQDQVVLTLPDQELIAVGVGWNGWEAYDEPAIPPDYQSVIVIHGELSAEGELITANHDPLDLPIEPFDYVAAGHLHHAHQVGANIVYPGSPERSGWRDQINTDPGWLDVYLDSGAFTTEHVSTPARPMIDLGQIVGTDRESCRQELETLILGLDDTARQEAMVRVLITDVDKSAMGSQRRYLADQLGPMVWQLQTDFLEAGRRFVAGSQIADMGMSQLAPLPDLFSQFVGEIEDTGDGFRERFRAKGSEALATAIAREADEAGQ